MGWTGPDDLTEREKKNWIKDYNLHQKAAKNNAKSNGKNNNNNNHSSAHFNNNDENKNSQNSYYQNSNITLTPIQSKFHQIICILNKRNCFYWTSFLVLSIGLFLCGFLFSFCLLNDILFNSIYFLFAQKLKTN